MFGERGDDDLAREVCGLDETDMGREPRLGSTKRTSGNHLHRLDSSPRLVAGYSWKSALGTWITYRLANGRKFGSSTTCTCLTWSLTVIRRAWSRWAWECQRGGALGAHRCSRRRRGRHGAGERDADNTLHRNGDQIHRHQGEHAGFQQVDVKREEGKENHVVRQQATIQILGAKWVCADDERRSTRKMNSAIERSRRCRTRRPRRKRSARKTNLPIRSWCMHCAMGG